jgi:hypothetical protein
VFNGIMGGMKKGAFIVIKHDRQKLRFDLVDAESLQEIVKALTYGAEKYNDTNYKTLVNPLARYFAASQRHLWEWKAGEQKDKESGLNHLAHACVNLIFLMEHERLKDSKERLNK